MYKLGILPVKLTTSPLHHFYRILQKRHPSVLFHGDTSRREIALTFDDGPHPRDTPQVLDVLAKHHVHATFFLVGQFVEKYPHLVKQIYNAGHQLALHCYRHLPFPMENASNLKGHLIQSRKAVANACSISPETIRYVRPPYGFFNKQTISILKELGLQLVLWDNMPLHFIQPTQWTIEQITKYTDPGSIIVLHDGNGHGSKVAPIVDTIVPMLKGKEYRFIKIEDMKRNHLHGQ
ncbi:MAG TPA: polysaccharide deacetylase family protein [Anaerolineales bacterium]|nr:polysaccharide deacetylase family protein [Anaerolineales bacterium]